MAQSPINVIVDPSSSANTGSPAPATNRPGSPLYTSSSQPQGGVLNLGSDYASPANAQAMKTDAYGNQYVVAANPIGGAAVVAQAATPVSPYYGMPVMMRQDLPSPSTWQALNGDPTAALNVHAKSKITVKYILPTTTGLAAGKSMMSIMNGSTSSIVRIQQVNIGTPYIYTTGNTGLLGLSGSYNMSVAMLHELRGITGQTKGASTTVISPSIMDSADTIDSNIVVMSNATVSGAASVPLHRQDANSPSGMWWYYRVDPNSKTFVLRPGQGASINPISSGLSSYNFDLELTITVASG